MNEEAHVVEEEEVELQKEEPAEEADEPEVSDAADVEEVEIEQPEGVMAVDEEIDEDEPEWAEEECCDWMKVLTWVGIIGGISFLLYLIFRKK